MLRPWHEYTEGLRYMRAVPLLWAFALVHIGWASGGGAAQILFTLFGEVVYPFGPAGMGSIWGFAGVGLLVGGGVANWLGDKLDFGGYKKFISDLLRHSRARLYRIQSVHGPSGSCWCSLRLPRFGMGVAGVLNTTLLLRTVPDAYRGRVFSTIESLVWGVMMLSMAAAGYVSGLWDPRMYRTAAGILSCSTLIIWIACRLERTPEGAGRLGIEREEVEVHGEPEI